MSEVAEWSDLPKELVDLIANRLFSNVELLRLRSICKSWRSAVALNKRFLNHSNRNRKRILSPYYHDNTCLLSPAAFFRVILSSCPNKGWLIKTLDVSESKKLLSPLSRLSMNSSDDHDHKTLDLLDFTVSEIHQSYDVEYEDLSYDFCRVVLVDNLVFAVDYSKQIWCCDSEAISSSSSNDYDWTRILDEETEYFSDVIVYKDQIYVLDLKGAIWWISLSELKIYQFGPSTPIDYYLDIDQCRDRKLVEYSGDLCVVHRFYKRFKVKRGEIVRTIGFRVYKMDEELVEWVEIKSLGGEAFVMAKETCFSVLAREYYGCLGNCIYFMDKGENYKEIICVFNLGDGVIKEMFDSYSQSCFHMFCPPFVG